MKVCGVNQGLTIWFTGLSGSGKSTLSEMLKNFAEEYYKRKTVILDGDKIRKGINQGLGFSQEDRAENIRRVSEMAKLFNQEGLICIVACISPYAKDRLRAKQIHENQNLRFFQVYLDCPLEECERRDPKGLYKKARQGLIQRFTGINDPYETPRQADLIISTQSLSLDQCFHNLQGYLCQHYFSDSNPKVSQMVYRDYICDVETLNLLQIFHQGWTQVSSFMNYEQILQSIYFKNYTKTDGSLVFQPLPLFLLVSQEFGKIIEEQPDILIRFINPYNNSTIAVLQNPKIEKFRQEEFSSRIFGTSSAHHPKIAQWLRKGEFILSGARLNFKCLRIYFNDGLDFYRKDVQTLKKEISKTGCDVVFAFQLRNPLHNGHLFLLENTKQELLQKGFKKPLLLLHPCGGWVKDDDVPLDVRIKQHELLLKKSSTFKEDQYILAIWPSPMYYAGPLQVLWHIKSREMLNVHYMVVGRDPAGVKHPENSKQDLYDPFDGHRVISIAKKLKWIQTEVIPFKVISWNKKSKMLMQFDESRKEEFQMISGSQMRMLAKNNQQVPQWFMNPDSWQILKEFYQRL